MLVAFFTLHKIACGLAMLLNRAWPLQGLTSALTLFPGASIHKVKDGLENKFEMMIKPSLVTSNQVNVCVCLCVSPHIRNGWVDCWSVPNFLLIIEYTWHPIYPQKADEQLKQSRKLDASVLCCYPLWEMPIINLMTLTVDIVGRILVFLTNPCRHHSRLSSMYVLICMCFVCEVSEMEESMLSALRPPEHTSVPPRYTSASTSATHTRLPTDPSELPPDRLHVEMEMSPDSQIILYGPLLRALISIKVPESLTLYSREFILTIKMNDSFDEWFWRC